MGPGVPLLPPIVMTHGKPPTEGMDLICAPLRGWGCARGGGGVVNCDMSQKIQ